MWHANASSNPSQTRELYGGKQAAAIMRKYYAAFQRPATHPGGLATPLALAALSA
jgi:hypothetical protein